MKILCVFGRHAYGDPARGESYEAVHFLPAFERIGHQVELFDSFSRAEDEDFASLNLRFVRCVKEYRPDVIFLVLMGYEIWAETLDLVRTSSPAVLVNWGTDDSWKFDQVSRYLAPHLDLHVTTHMNSAYRAEQLGLSNILRSNWAASSAHLASPLPSAECEYDVSFIGSFYGNRRAWIEGLRSRGIKVASFGHGSEGGVVAAGQIPQIYRKSRISLNFADSGRQLNGLRLKHSRQIKARTFEVPGAGGCLMTEPADGLSDYFHVGMEIETFNSLDELAGKIRHYLANPDERDSLAHAGHVRVSEEHTYDRRFTILLKEVFARLPEERMQVPWKLDAAMLAPFVVRHRNNRMIRPLRTVLEKPAQAVLGRHHGSRAARRILFELSWRMLGERTFEAGGLPGRLFFRES